MQTIRIVKTHCYCQFVPENDIYVFSFGDHVLVSDFHYMDWSAQIPFPPLSFCPFLSNFSFDPCLFSFTDLVCARRVCARDREEEVRFSYPPPIVMKADH